MLQITQSLPFGHAAIIAMRSVSTSLQSKHDPLGLLVVFSPVSCTGTRALSRGRNHSKHKFLEGPVWSASDGYLLFTDVPMNTIQKIDRKACRLFREQSGGASGNAFDDKGRLYTCETHTRRVTRTDKKGAVETLVDQFEGKKLNGPNDITVTKHGHVYFTDPAFGSAGERRELPFYGVFHISPKGQVEASLKLQTRPNGIVASPDGAILYVTNSDERNVRAYDITKDGMLQNERDIHFEYGRSARWDESGRKGESLCCRLRSAYLFSKGRITGNVKNSGKAIESRLWRRRSESFVHHGSHHSLPGSPRVGERSCALLAVAIQIGQSWV